MKHEKDKVYNELDRRLRAYADNSMSAIPIDETVKDRIWNNLNRDIHEQAMRRRYKVRKTYRLAFIISVVLVLIVSLDLSSNASLFKRLLTTVTGNTLQFHSRDVSPYEDEYDEELDNKISIINENNETKFLSPALGDMYQVEEIMEMGKNLSIYLCNEAGDMIEITQRHVSERAANTVVQYESNKFESDIINKNGIEYRIFQNTSLVVGLVQIEDIEVTVLGSNYKEVLKIMMSLH